MFEDDNLSLYAYVLMLSGVIFGASFFAQEPRIDVAGLDLGDIGVIASNENAIETGDFGVGSIPGHPVPLGAESWNYPDISWRTYEDGMQEMARTNKPALLVMHAGWCLDCRNYQRLFQTPEITRYADDYVFILVDVERQPDLRRRYDVDGDYIPRTFLLRADGGMARERTGGHARQRYYVNPYEPNELAELLAGAR